MLKKELVGHLRTRRGVRRSKKARTRGQGRGQIVDAVSIRERPPEVEDIGDRTSGGASVPFAVGLLLIAQPPHERPDSEGDARGDQRVSHEREPDRSRARRVEGDPQEKEL